MSPRPRPDFVQVQLTEHARKLAGDAPLNFATTHMQYTFSADKAVEVLKYAEWPTLQKTTDGEGNPLFELAPNQGDTTDAVV